MAPYERIALWRRTLASTVPDPDSAERDRLRVAYESARGRAATIAETIARDLPDYTVHDVTHCDALWEYADLIAGPEYAVTPCEAFVLGCAFLVHDLGMGLAAYPEGPSGLKRLNLWKDTVADLRKQLIADESSPEEATQIELAVERVALANVLRVLHAERAERLASMEWPGPTAGTRFHLIEDAELRASYGRVIGLIAFSHWWPIERVGDELSAVVGALPGFPREWTVDPMKAACLLRCADYCDLDGRRAPAFVEALRGPSRSSARHWRFQGNLYQPRLDGDRLVYTAKAGFTIDDVEAWWLCFDTLAAVDAELRRVDSLLADMRRSRLAARGVWQIEEPSRLVKLIPTDGWRPVDTRIRVSAVADLVGKLGGRGLYGDTEVPPLRELLQNAADAVRARRAMEGRTADWGEIQVLSGQDSTGPWIQLQDNGIGMSEKVLTGPFLDFGATFWGSALMHSELPGLSASGFEATGRYGIGFFAVFMWGHRVEVLTQRFDRGRTSAVVLMFQGGLNDRPVLRSARPDEYLLEGGTRVRAWLSDKRCLERLRSSFDKRRELTLAEVCARIAPCLDVTLKVQENGSDLVTAVNANDWVTIESAALIERIGADDEIASGGLHGSDSAAARVSSLRVIRDAAGQAVGRASIPRSSEIHVSRRCGIVTVGGLRACTLNGIAGVLVGEPRSAARDAAIPVVPLAALQHWAESERQACIDEKQPPEIMEEFAHVLCSVGVEPQHLPIARAATGWVVPEQISALARTGDEFALVDRGAVRLLCGDMGSIELAESVISVRGGALAIVNSHRPEWLLWPALGDERTWGKFWFYHRTLEGAVVQALATGWGCALSEVLAASSLEPEGGRPEREVGTIKGEPVRTAVALIRRPKPA